MKNHAFDLFVFHRDMDQDLACLDGKAKGIVVDLERRGKRARQCGFDTQINEHTVSDLLQIKQQSDAYVICRINGLNEHSPEEVDQVIAAGADEILVPMIKHESEVEQIFRLVRGRTQIGLMIETAEAVECADKLDAYPLARIYVGLNDLRISRGAASIFTALADGTLEKIREKICQAPFGFAGLTIPGKGDPLSVQYLVDELARLDCRFTFLRRSFFRDTQNIKVQMEIPRVLDVVQKARSRSEARIQNDQVSLQNELQRIFAAAVS